MQRLFASLVALVFVGAVSAAQIQIQVKPAVLPVVADKDDVKGEKVTGTFVKFEDKKLTVKVGDKEMTYTVSDKTKVLGPRGTDLKDGFGAAFFKKPGAELELVVEKDSVVSATVKLGKNNIKPQPIDPVKPIKGNVRILPAPVPVPVPVPAVPEK